MKLDPYLTPYTKINSKLIKDLNVRPKTIKLLEDKVGQNLHDIGFDNDLLDMTPQAQATKEKIDKLKFMNILKICISKDNINRVKSQPTEREKISASHISGKKLISRVYEEFLKLSNKKTAQFKNGQRN